MVIESISNNLVKQACSLQQKKFRDLDGKFLGQGVRLVLDAYLSNPSLVERVFATESCLREIEEFVEKNPARFKPALSGIKSKIVLVGQQIIKKLSLTDSAQEVVGIFNKPKESAPQEYAMFLDRIRDPGNLGSILRTASAAGYSLILSNCADVYSPKVVQSSMSAILSADFCFGSTKTLLELKANGYTVAAADLEGENLFNSKLNPPLCVVIGNEANGVSDEILALSHKKITIPMQRAESLNASVSAGIIMYHFKEASNVRTQ